RAPQDLHAGFEAAQVDARPRLDREARRARGASGAAIERREPDHAPAGYEHLGRVPDDGLEERAERAVAGDPAPHGWVGEDQRDAARASAPRVVSAERHAVEP